MSDSEDNAAPSLASRLSGSHVGLRPDLRVVRHLFRGQPAYVLRDPMTMQSHRFDLGDYEIIVRLDAERSLGEVFEGMVESGLLEREREEAFYAFIVDLHQLAFLNLPVSNSNTLYRRFLHKQRAQRIQRIKGFLFLRLPLFNPDAFLERTADWVRPLYTKTAFAVWCALMLAFGVLLLRNWDTFSQPAHGILEAGNLSWMWITLIALKVVHEFGHAYACKLRGGPVPEMGAFFVVLTPLAYVDATSAWGFPRRLDRLIVSLGGMYVETAIAAIAMFVWAMTTSPFVAALAHNVVLLASLVTIVMNVNPLMRFDGYYILSDWVEIPNLRARAERCVRDALKHVALGLPDDSADLGRGMRAFLLTFGIAGAIYKVVIIVTISLLIASKFFLVGMLTAAALVGSQLVGIVRGLAEYLLRSDETAPMRARARAVAVGLAVGIPLISLGVPIPSSVLAPAQVTREVERVLRAPQDGFIEHVEATSGTPVDANALVVQLHNPELQDALSVALAGAQVAALEARASRAQGPAAGLREVQRAAVRRSELALRERQLSELAVHTPVAGHVVQGVDSREIGRFVRRGEPLATVAAGPWQVRALLTADEVARARPEPGQSVDVRVVSDPGLRIEGSIRHLSPAGTRTIEAAALTHVGGGEIPVDETGENADQPYFELLVEIPPEYGEHLRSGVRGQIRLAARYERLAVGARRSLLRVANRFSQD